MLKSYGVMKHKWKILNSLLPNSVNLEFLRSLDSLKNGTEMKYVLTYFD